MDKKPANPLARFEHRKANKALIAAAVALVGVLVAGVVAAIRSDDLNAALFFALGIAAFACLVLIHVASSRRTAAVDDRKFIRWDAAMPELQRQNVNIEVRELARLLNVGTDQLPDLLSAYIVAEDLALRQIQQEENLPLMRHVEIGKSAFDGVLVDRDLITCIEVTFLVAPDLRQDKIDAALKKIHQAKSNLLEKRSRLRLELMLVLVTQLKPEENEMLRERLVKRRFKDMQIDNVEIRFLDFEMLQKVYVSE